MDAFFASVELLRYPELRGQAVVVGGRNVPHPVLLADGSKRYARLREYVGRGVVTTSTYEARAFGVFSGMGLMKSAQLAPEAILLPANFAAYHDYSQRFKAAVATIAPKIEDRGIDEIYIDLSDIPEDSLALAQRIKQAVFEATGLSCSIGITLLGMAEVESRIWPLPVRKINGIGPKTTAHLQRLGIDTVGQLAQAPVEFLVARFGQSYGRWLHQAAHGLDERELVIEREPKSISRETTFERDLHAKLDRTELSERFTALCLRVAEDLKESGYAARTIGIKLRYADFHVITRDLTLPEEITAAGEIRRAAGQCLKRVSLDQRIRLLGVRASNLRPVHAEDSFRPGEQALLPFG